MNTKGHCYPKSIILQAVSMCVSLCYNFAEKISKEENSFRGTIMVQKGTNYLQIKLYEQKEKYKLKCCFIAF